MMFLSQFNRAGAVGLITLGPLLWTLRTVQDRFTRMGNAKSGLITVRNSNGGEHCARADATEDNGCICSRMTILTVASVVLTVYNQDTESMGVIYMSGMDSSG